ncbi:MULTISPECIES: hypothetical protein [unclassified Streptomyces]|uniref:hypothetical protein n=1 Tax=unclassified Streptomyces TaxID=2593676 RepID=UPI00332F0AA2
MPSFESTRTTETLAAPYRSPECCIGTHLDCAESSPISAPVDLPVAYETCVCPCHSLSHRSMPTEVGR